MQTAKQIAANEIARRRGTFERHVADCDMCTTPIDSVHIQKALCMSGAIMLTRYVNAIVTSREAV